jgi:hypothetical protein
MPNGHRLLLLLSALSAACASEIGDECVTSNECATSDGDRICMTELLEGFPDGYCTTFNCDPGSCASEAICVGYRSSLANAAECQSPSERPRLQRTYCMRSCASDGDCRTGYACIDVGADDDPWGAEVLETGSRAAKTKICAVPYSEPEDEPQRSAGVCEWEVADPAEPTSASHGSSTDGGAASGSSVDGGPDGSPADSASNDGGPTGSASDDGGPAGGVSNDGGPGVVGAADLDASAVDGSTMDDAEAGRVALPAAPRDAAIDAGP